jgi:shikimate dehydrogenase
LLPLLRESPQRLVIANRTHARAVDSRRRSPRWALSAVPPPSLRDNASMSSSTPPASGWKQVPRTCGRRDSSRRVPRLHLVYANARTPFLVWATEQGAAKTADGLGMLIEQAAESFALWRGVRPETAPVFALMRG